MRFQDALFAFNAFINSIGTHFYATPAIFPHLKDQQIFSGGKLKISNEMFFSSGFKDGSHLASCPNQTSFKYFQNPQIIWISLVLTISNSLLGSHPASCPNVTHFLSSLQPKCLRRRGYLMDRGSRIFNDPIELKNTSIQQQFRSNLEEASSITKKVSSSSWIFNDPPTPAGRTPPSPYPSLKRWNGEKLTGKTYPFGKIVFEENVLDFQGHSFISSFHKVDSEKMSLRVRCP